LTVDEFLVKMEMWLRLIDLENQPVLE